MMLARTPTQSNLATEIIFAAAAGKLPELKIEELMDTFRMLGIAEVASALK